MQRIKALVFKIKTTDKGGLVMKRYLKPLGLFPIIFGFILMFSCGPETQWGDESNQMIIQNPITQVKIDHEASDDLSIPTKFKVSKKDRADMLDKYGDALKDEGIYEEKEVELALYTLSIIERCPEGRKKLSSSNEKIDLDTLRNNIHLCSRLSHEELTAISDAMIESQQKDTGDWFDVIVVGFTMSFLWWEPH